MSENRDAPASPPRNPPQETKPTRPFFLEKVLKGFIRIAGSFWTYRHRRGVSLGVISGGITCSAQMLKSSITISLLNASQLESNKARESEALRPAPVALCVRTPECR